MVHYLTASTTLVEDPNVVPGIHILQFTMASDSGSQGFDSSSNLHRYLHSVPIPNPFHTQYT